MQGLNDRPSPTQFVIFNPWKVPWKWIAFSQNSFVTWFVISPDYTRHWMTCKRGLYVKSYCFSKQQLSGLKIVNCTKQCYKVISQAIMAWEKFRWHSELQTLCTLLWNTKFRAPVRGVVSQLKISVNPF